MAFQFQVAQTIQHAFTVAVPPVSFERIIDTLTNLGLTTNLKLCLDAGDASSYTSGQSWLDRSGGGYDFYRGSGSGSDGADPTFNGTAGRQSANEYWSLDGGDYLTYDTTNETWMQTLHKDNAVLSYAVWAYLANPVLAIPTIFGTVGDYNAGTGVGVGYTSTNAVRLYVQNAGANVIEIASGTNLNIGAWNFIGFALDEATGTARYNVNGQASTASAAYSSPSSGSASQTMQIGASGNAQNIMKSGSRLANLSIWQDTLSAASLLAIFQNTRGRFGV